MSQKRPKRAARPNLSSKISITLSMTDTYKVVCDNIDLVFHLRVLSDEEQNNLFKQVREKMDKSEKFFVLHEYKEFICKKLVVDYEEIITECTEGPDTPSYIELVSTLYIAVCIAYPTVAIDFVCSDINAERVIRNIKTDNPVEFLKNLTNSFKQQIDKQTKKKKKAVKSKSPPQINTLNDFDRLEKEMKLCIIGQDHAIDTVIKHLKLISAGLSHSSSFFFVGPTGVGKTELSKIIGANYSGNFFKINCAEYAGAHEYAKLIGSPPGYVGHSDKSILKDKADISNKWVFLFDEIEKADAKLSDFLLSMLDDGTCTDNLGNILDFSQSLFIFTSNQGVGEVKYNTLGFVKQTPTKESINSTIFDSVKKKFSPEFMNRIDDVIFFNSLTKENIRTIVKNKLLDYPIITNDELVDYVIDKSYSFEYGARNVSRYIKNNIATILAESILSSNTKDKLLFEITIQDNKPIILRTVNEEELIPKKPKKRFKKVLEADVGGENKTPPQDEAGGKDSSTDLR